MGCMPFPLTNKYYKITEQNSKLTSTTVTWPHLFFIRNHTPHSIVPFMPIGSPSIYINFFANTTRVRLQQLHLK